MIRYFAGHPTAANLLMIAIIALGLAAAPMLKRETFPDFPPDKIEVRVLYPGASPEEVEEAICQRIEDALDGVNDLDEILCESLEGIATATAEMHQGANFDRFLNDVKTEVEAIDNFPDEAEAPVIRQLGRTDFVVSVAVTGPMSVPHLKAYAEQIKDRMLAAGAISQVNIQGFSDHQIRIEAPAQMLRQYGLSVSDIADAVARQSVDLPAGAVETDGQDVLVRFADERRSPHEFEDLVVIAGKSGAEVRLGDIATISDRFELDEDKAFFNGRRAAILEIVKTRDEDTLTVMDAVSEFVAGARQTAPPSVEFAITNNVSSIVRDRLSMLLRNGGQGLLLVFLTLWLFFSFRFSFWVAAGLPISFLGTVVVMSLIGYSIDMITMVALLIAIGLLMDDAIVIAENVATHLKRGKSALDAAIDGTREVAPGVLASFATTVCVFGALAFLKGDIGNVLKVLPVVLIATLAVSLAEAFLILPHHLKQSLAGKERQQPSAFRQRFEVGLEWVRERVLGSIVDAAIAWRYLAAGSAIGLFLATISILPGGVLKFRPFPELDGDVVLARILLPQGTPLERTEAVVARTVKALEQVSAEFAPRQPGGQPLVRNIAIQFNKNLDAHEAGPHLATVQGDLLSAEVRDAAVDDVLNRWRQLVGEDPDVISLKFTEPQIGPAGRAIDIRLHGGDLAGLAAASLDLRQWLARYDGVLDLTDDLRPGKPEIRLRLRQGASALGLDAAGIAGQLRAAFFGKTASEIQVGPEAYEIDVRLAEADQNTLVDLEYFTVTTAEGKAVPLATVAVLEPGRGHARIARIDGRRTVTVQGDVDTSRANASEITADLRRRFLGDFKVRHPGVDISFEGQAKEGATTGASLRRGFALGLVGIFLLLALQFRSYVEPLVVMIAIPLAAIGAIWGHVVMGLDVSMPSLVGFASLAGVVVNDSILLVTFIKIRRAGGAPVAEAARLASRGRFRAVLLTSLTTIAGLLPLLFEQSLQAQVLVPLVTSLAFGLMASTVLVLVVVPVLYAILDDFGLAAAVTENAGGADRASPAVP